uniref:Uncharacterized protein n=1 Tax=Oryza glumipatula TaxID=40148 RepID=A0A0D9ZAL2_9ORYZ
MDHGVRRRPTLSRRKDGERPLILDSNASLVSAPCVAASTAAAATAQLQMCEEYKKLKHTAYQNLESTARPFRRGA